MSAPIPICPCCGFDIAQAKRVTDGRFTYDPRVGFHVDGRRLRATPQVHELLGAVMRASGGLLKANILAERLGYEGDETTNLVAVLLTKARHAIAATGARFPIETVPRCGYRWNLDAQARTVTKHTVNAA